jgi:hypothetical protein
MIYRAVNKIYTVLYFIKGNEWGNGIMNFFLNLTINQPHDLGKNESSRIYKNGNKKEICLNLVCRKKGLLT